MISREAKSKRDRRAAGLCAGCGKPSKKYRCPACAVAHRAQENARLGTTPRAKNGPGRPTIY